MPLTAKGSSILASMQKEYGAEKGESVFYASRNAGKISGVDAKDMSGPEFEKLKALFAEWIEEERAEPEHAVDGMAFDRMDVDFGPKSGRQYDENGYLHIRCPISKACVNPYWGKEIPDYEGLRLKPDKIYNLFRDPAELEKAAPTFNNMPLLTRHVPQSSAESSPELRVGSTGTDTSFDHPYLNSTLVIWDDGPIAGIESNQKRELSSSYRYRADMVPGEHEGT